MFGPAPVKKFVTDYLMVDLPERLLTYRNAWNLDDERLPEPVEYLTYEPIAIDAWPMLYTILMSTNSITREDYTPGYDPLYRVRYSLRTYVWVRGHDSETATDTRDRLSTVLRSSLLDHQCLAAADITGSQVLIDEGSVREEFSDLTLLKGDRVLAGAYCAYDININEAVVRATIGQVAQIQTQIEALAR
jgi:hypothetical protein